MYNGKPLCIAKQGTNSIKTRVQQQSTCKGTAGRQKIKGKAQPRNFDHTPPGSGKGCFTYLKKRHTKFHFTGLILSDLVRKFRVRNLPGDSETAIPFGNSRILGRFNTWGKEHVSFGDRLQILRMISGSLRHVRKNINNGGTIVNRTSAVD